MTYKRDVQYSTQYRRDYKKAKKQGKDISQLREIIRLLANDGPLPEKHNDHSLQLILTRLASHSELDF